MGSLLLDVRYAARQIARRPMFALVIVLTLGLGIGANVTIFTFVDALLLRPLPYPEAEQLVYIDGTAPKQGVELTSVSYPDFVDWRNQNRVFEDMSAYRATEFNLGGGDGPERVSGSLVSANIFTVLQIDPMLGRGFSDEENQPGKNNVAILGHGIWERRFASNPAVLGQTVTVDDQPHTIIAIMPAHFSFPDNTDIWVPIAAPTNQSARSIYSYRVIGRLKAGATVEQARADLAAVMRGLAEQFPDKKNSEIVVFKLRDFYVRNSGLALLFVFLMVTFVLAMACLNVANLFIARSVERKKEIAIRISLGAGRWRVIRQLLVESILLAGLGGLFGLLLGQIGRDVILASVPVQMPAWMNFDLDFRIIGFLILVSLLTGVLFGLLPAIQLSRPDLNDALKEGESKNFAGIGQNGMRNLLVVGDIALALVPLVASGLMIKAFLKVQQVDPGFRPENVLTLKVSLPDAKYRGRQVPAFYQQAIQAVTSLPGVQEVAAVSSLPMSGSFNGSSFSVEGAPPTTGQLPIASRFTITNDYFRTMGISLLRGREFDERDAAERAGNVVIINESMASRYWPNEDAIGKRLKYGPPQSADPWMTVVGIAADVRQLGLTNALRETIYLPLDQRPTHSMALLVRAAGPAIELVDPARKAIFQIDPNLPLYEAKTMEQVVAESLWRLRIFSWLFGIFAFLALALATVGVYGVISRSVSQRTHEIGIRIALGAVPADVLRMILKNGIGLALLGVAIGLFLAGLLSRFLASMLYGLDPLDLTIFGGCAIALSAVAFIATYVPARKSTKVDPAVALRYE